MVDGIVGVGVIVGVVVGVECNTVVKLMTRIDEELKLLLLTDELSVDVDTIESTIK